MFRTPVSLEPINRPISLASDCLLVGSCFADFIGGQLARYKFTVDTNPFGVIFHPLAQFRVLELALSGLQPEESTYVNSQGIWYNYLFHGSIANSSLPKLKDDIRYKLDQLNTRLGQLEFLLLTFGTAIQYQHQNIGQIVANCHKVPQSEFNKKLTLPEDITEAFSKLYQRLANQSPQVILSVSPIRHIKEGIEQNSVSKSILRVACQQIIDMHPEINYFPGYEIMIDDLRDYRFFEKDMVHPNETARDYIWEMFTANYLDRSSQDFVAKWQKVLRNLAHQPFHPHSPAHQEFVKKTIKMIEQLGDTVDITKEIASLKSSLK